MPPVLYTKLLPDILNWHLQQHINIPPIYNSRRSCHIERPKKTIESTSIQWRRLHRARGHVPPTFTNDWARGHLTWLEEQQTRNWRNCILTKWPSRKRSPTDKLYF